MNWTELIARFHPLLVHLPIGILVLSLIIAIATRFEKWQSLRATLSIALFWGALSAILSCLSGFFLSQLDDYDADLMYNHKWSGIGLAIVATGAWAAEKWLVSQKQWLTLLTQSMISVLLMITGHLGGSLTHGKDFLTKGLFQTPKREKIEITPAIAEPLKVLPKQDTPFFQSPKSDTVKHVITKKTKKNVTIAPDSGQNNQVAESVLSKDTIVRPIYVYQDLIKPILENRCYSCHGENKSKGGLRLHTPEFIAKGGHEGPALVPGDPDKSYMYGSLILPLEHEYHMPPEGKPQLTQLQIQQIQWWILHGGSFDKTAQEMAGNNPLPDFISKH